ncbi:hypothetical protein ASPWEDRAFT_33834 [Aspergillus wentii DTO 134E9]|uniref:Uncharacterized protein n=1 Tax=Aspergillus wentii DTO 134E9 TaxID=1073089 RepID=A0A1L9S021_ASPWE|nr:uncharacterized protein ASPWEDRAFT_33834 [Aspergillus wentii DTO 134E9]OJJ40437.1 hypothetical protein ASPWEDRAFT_33834 [Aspergillus wentii DTO 134E9]
MSNTTTTKPIGSQSVHLSANFAAKQLEPCKSPCENPVSIGYDHEIYLQLVGGGKMTEKTPNQVYLEV